MMFEFFLVLKKISETETRRIFSFEDLGKTFNGLSSSFGSNPEIPFFTLDELDTQQCCPPRNRYIYNDLLMRIFDISK
jgi:hypothetical protein